ncbi:unnamed protein product [Arctia plantaginis]|uniref:Uncharacterized protein n=1 Tax=Arctia plantaginis TaxID=874455 RepID=A0A8S0ZG62_ARCPL|nr:unnamed protein product [Arctia plantaginis]
MADLLQVKKDQSRFIRRAGEDTPNYGVPANLVSLKSRCQYWATPARQDPPFMLEDHLTLSSTKTLRSYTSAFILPDDNGYERFSLYGNRRAHRHPFISPTNANAPYRRRWCLPDLFWITELYSAFGFLTGDPLLI